MAEWASALVGRREELRALQRALDVAVGGASRVLALRGEPGIGKWRLLAEVASLAQQRGLLVLAGRAAELERDLSFALLVDALEPLMRERALAELEDWQLGELAAVLPLAGAHGTPASGERHRLARAVRAALERVAAERPSALLLDDVHWADPASADVPALLLHRPPRGGVLLALATRAGRGATPARRAHHVERAARPGDLAAVDLLVTAAGEVAPAAPATAAGWYEAALRLLRRRSSTALAA